MKNTFTLLLLAFNLVQSFSQTNSTPDSSYFNMRVSQEMYDIKIYQDSSYQEEIDNTVTIKLDTFEIHLCMPIEQRASVLFTTNKKIYKAFKKNQSKAIKKYWEGRSGSAESDSSKFIFINDDAFGFNYWLYHEDPYWCRLYKNIIKGDVVYGARIVEEIIDPNNESYNNKAGTYYMIIRYGITKGTKSTYFGFDMIKLVVE